MWTIQPRARDLTRNYDPIIGWSSLELVERYPTNDTWVIEGPWAALAPLGVPGTGCILDRDGEQITSGRMWQRYRWVDQDTGQLRCRVSFVQDNVGGRIVYPDATHALTETPSTFAHAYHTRTGTVEDLILDYIRWSLADLALVDRRLANLVLPASLGRGGTATVNARFDNLGVLVQDLAEAGRLRVRVVHDESLGVDQPRLALRIDEVPDVSADVRFGLGSGLGILTAYADTITAPEVTHAIVAGGGELAARIVSQVADLAAADLWDVHVEQFVDQRQTTDAAEMVAAGRKALAAGAEPATIELGVTDGPDVQYRRNYGPGYTVGIDGPDGPLDNIVREARTTVTAEDDGAATETVTVVVGTAGATTDTNADRQADDQLRRIELLERTT